MSTNIKKLLASLLAIAMVISLMPNMVLPARAESTEETESSTQSDENITYYQGGYDVSWYTEAVAAGTMEATLMDAEDLYGLAAVVNGVDADGKETKDANGNVISAQTLSGWVITLGADIYVNKGDADDWEPKETSLYNWFPIGRGNTTYKNPTRCFSGTLDGDNHFISGLYCYMERSNALITYAVDATIENLAIINSYFCAYGSASQHTASFVSRGHGATLRNLYSNARIEIQGKDWQVGGIIGTVSSNSTYNSVSFGVSTIDSVVYEGTINTRSQANGRVGGILGGDDGKKVEISNCLFSGSIDSDDAPVGGIVGFLGNSSSSLKNCLSAGALSLTNTGNKGAVIGQANTTVVENNYFDEAYVANGVALNCAGNQTDAIKNANYAVAKDAMQGTGVLAEDGALAGLSEGWVETEYLPVPAGVAELYLRINPQTHDHSYSEDWEYDASWHWHECTAKEGCHAVDGLAAHVYSDATDETCNVCDYSGRTGTTFGDTSWYWTGADEDGKYYISDVEDLYGFAYLVNNGFEDFQDKTVCLTADIKVNDGDASLWGEDATGLRAWVPVGNNYTHAFRGTFDGQGHQISGLYIKKATNVAFFDWTINATVQNLAIVDSYYHMETTTSYGHGLATFVIRGYGAKMKNLYSNAILVNTSGAEYAGTENGTKNVQQSTWLTAGVVAFVNGNVGYSNDTLNKTLVDSCVFAGEIIDNANGAGQFVGGIAGYDDKGGSTSVIQNCLFIGTIHSNDSDVGGIVGGLVGDGSAVMNCVSAGKLYRTVVDTGVAVNGAAAGTNTDSWGGVIGGLDGSVVISDCYYIPDAIDETEDEYSFTLNAWGLGTPEAATNVVPCTQAQMKGAQVVTDMPALDYVENWTVYECDYPVPLSGGVMDVYETYSTPDDEHAEAVADPAVDPSCEETGLTEGSHCPDCGDVIEAQEVIPATGHSYPENWTEDGENHKKVCANDCGEDLVEPHQYTYSTDGTGVCECGATTKCTHDYDYTSNNDATCTQDGTKYGVCSICGNEVDVADEGSMLGHSYPENWTEDGENHKKVCANDCGEDLIEAHSYTYSTDGTGECVCGATTECSHSYKYTSNNDATCTQDGTKRGVCSICGNEVDVADEENPATGHSYGEGVYTEANFEQGAYWTYTCACGDSYTVDDPDHPQLTAVAIVNGTDKYETLEKAIAAAQPGETVELVADATVTVDTTLVSGITYVIPVDKTLTVAAGAEVIAEAGATLNCYGKIVVAGKADISELSYGTTFGACGGKLTVTATGEVNMLKSWENIWTPVNDAQLGAMLTGCETGAKINVGSQEWQLADSGWAHTNHVSSASADCENDEVCTVCGAVITEKLGHSYGDDGYCSVCGDEDPAASFVAQVGEKKYLTLAEAIDAADGETVTLLQDASGDGIIINKDLTLDLGGYEYTFTGTLVGSTGTKANGFQILEGNTVIIKNGSLVMGEDATPGHANATGNNFVIQNYADLTLDGVNVTGRDNSTYVVSNNCGTSVIKGGSVITAKGTNVAVDVCRYAGYNNVSVTIEDATIVGEIEISGNVDVENGQSCALVLGKEANLDEATFDISATDATISREEGATHAAPAGYKWDENNVLVACNYVAQVNNGQKYESLEEAIKNAQSEDRVDLLQDASGNGIIIDKDLYLYLNGHTYTFDGVLVGSEGTKSNGFQIMEGYTVIINNGSLVMSETAVRGHDKKVGNNFVIQNYANLTLGGVNVTGNSQTSYVVSNNCGSTQIIGGSVITAQGENVALDACRFMSYDKVSVSVVNATIVGIIEVSGNVGKDQVCMMSLDGGNFGNATLRVLGNSNATVTKAEDVELDAPDGYKWENNTLVACNYVAQVGNDKYESLADAFAVGGEVKLLSDITLTEGLVVEAGKVVVLDLNGKIVRGVDSTASTSALITNNGTLTIKDSVGGGKLTTEPVNPDMSEIPGYASTTITNNGTLTLVSGTIENTATGGACYAIDSCANSVTNIQGGIIKAYKTAVRLYTWQTSDVTVEMNISGGEIFSEQGYGVQTYTNGGEFKLNISGGTITSTREDYPYAVYLNAQNSDAVVNSTVNITGGTFASEFALSNKFTAGMTEDTVSVTDGTFAGVTYWGTLEHGFISGGTFSSAVAEEMCAEGFIPEDNGDGTYGVKVGNYVARNTTTGVGYESIEEAIAAAEIGEEIVLLADVTIEETLLVNGITIDGADHSITATWGDLSSDSGDAVIQSTTGMTLKNLTVNGGRYGVKVTCWTTKDLTQDIVLENVNIENSVRALNVTGASDERDLSYGLVVTGGKLAGKVSFTGELNSVSFEGVEFTTNNGAKGDVLEPHGDMSLTNCTFADGYELSAADLPADAVVTKDNATTIAAPVGYVWNDDNVLVVATFTVTWIVDGVVTTETYEYGATPVAPNTDKAADETYTYTFAGWDKEIVAVTADVTYTATYNKTYIEYTVKFVDDDGTVITEKTYHYGDVVEVPADPTKAADETYTYEFAGWDNEVVACAGDATYTATYNETYIEYTVKFVDEDGTVITEKTYHYGDVVEVPADPTKAADATYTYEFAGWDSEVVACAGDATYTATYNETYIEYKVKFVDEDGTVISEQTYHYGDTVAVPENPTKAEDETYTYTFKCWNPEVVHTVEGHATYTAVFEAVQKGPVVDESLVVDNVALSMESYIGAQFTINLDAAGVYDSIYVVIQHETPDGVINEKLTVNIGGDRFIYEYKLAAKQMNDKVTATTYGVLNGVTYVGPSKTWSVRDGALERLDKYYEWIEKASTAEKRETYRKICVVVANMLAYGAEAQKTFAYNNATENLVTYGVKAEYLALVSNDTPSIENEEAVDKTGYSSYMQYSALMAEANIQMSMRFKLPTTNPKDYEARITYGTETVVIDGANFYEVSKWPDYWTVVFDQLPVKEARQAIKITMYEKASGTAVSPEYSLSIENVAYDKVANNTDFIYALMRFSDAAKAYFG